MKRLLFTLAVAFVHARLGAAQEPPHVMPPGMTHEEHLRQMQKDAALKKRGAAAMEFDQETTAHHFYLTPDGGAIEVVTKDPGDTTGQDQIRSHLRDIATEFAAGNFGKPLATHAETPPGVSVLQKVKRAVQYVFESTPAGGRVWISTRDTMALAAIHEFLRYQIREHGTGDALTVGAVRHD